MLHYPAATLLTMAGGGCSSHSIVREGGLLLVSHPWALWSQGAGVTGDYHLQKCCHLPGGYLALPYQSLCLVTVRYPLDLL